jgi:hypothetical protein
MIIHGHINLFPSDPMRRIFQKDPISLAIPIASAVAHLSFSVPLADTDNDFH